MYAAPRPPMTTKTIGNDQEKLLLPTLRCWLLVVFVVFRFVVVVLVRFVFGSSSSSAIATPVRSSNPTVVLEAVPST